MAGLANPASVPLAWWQGCKGTSLAEARPKRSGELTRAIREIRIANSERVDAAADVNSTEQARLEMLAEALEGVTAELPPGHDQLLSGLLPGNPPRFRVDATSFVVMGRDKRQYQFLKDTRLGRTTLAESADVDVIADIVTRYVAERIVERDQAIEGDRLAQPMHRKSAVPTDPAARQSVEIPLTVFGGLCFGMGLLAGTLLIAGFVWLTAG